MKEVPTLTPRGRLKSLILFDEIEEADPILHNLLLQIFDEGKIALNSREGGVTHFNNSIIIMTSNLGSDKLVKERIGFGCPREVTEASEKQNYEIVRADIKNFFSPKFTNRISKIAVFRSLSREAMHEILELRLEELNGRLAVKLELDEEAKQFIVTEAMKYPEEAARMLTKRVVQFINTDLAPLLNTKILEKGDVVIAQLGDDGNLRFCKKV